MAETIRLTMTLTAEQAVTITECLETGSGYAIPIASADHELVDALAAALRQAVAGPRKKYIGEFSHTHKPKPAPKPKVIAAPKDPIPTGGNTMSRLKERRIARVGGKNRLVRRGR